MSSVASLKCLLGCSRLGKYRAQAKQRTLESQSDIYDENVLRKQTVEGVFVAWSYSYYFIYMKSIYYQLARTNSLCKQPVIDWVSVCVCECQWFHACSFLLVFACAAQRRKSVLIQQCKSSSHLTYFTFGLVRRAAHDPDNTKWSPGSHVTFNCVDKASNHQITVKLLSAGFISALNRLLCYNVCNEKKIEGSDSMPQCSQRLFIKNAAEPTGRKFS